MTLLTLRLYREMIDSIHTWMFFSVPPCCIRSVCSLSASLWLPHTHTEAHKMSLTLSPHLPSWQETHPLVHSFALLTIFPAFLIFIMQLLMSLSHTQIFSRGPSLIWMPCNKRFGYSSHSYAHSMQSTHKRRYFLASDDLDSRFQMLLS